MKWVQVKEMYRYANDNNIPLLSDFASNNENILFWNEYRENYSRYDKTFRRYYNSFRYFMQEPLALRYDEEIPIEHIQEITLDFIDEVYNHLMINAKKYEELYRVNVLSNENYSIVDNYNIVETMNKEINRDNTDTYGTRTDTTNDDIGARTDTSTDTIAGFNSSDFQNSDKTTLVTGIQENSRDFVKGSQTDSHLGIDTETSTFTRKGNIGVKTVSEMIEEHKEVWETWEFYSYIFKEICAELLLN